MRRLGVLTVAIAAVFGATTGEAQRSPAPPRQQDTGPAVYVDASQIVRDATDRAERNGGYGWVDEPPVVTLPPVVSRGGVTSYATNGAYLDGAARRYDAGGSSVVTVQSGGSYGDRDRLVSSRVQRGSRHRIRSRRQ
ncbi:hypothetical protein [Sphingomonas sp. PAMC 26621]|uniref:hypothetical protein n=1 Tax=Sphingomonas sp. PAMC 26621 TaxID=1112213 RepID=UPI0002DA9E69|nr:hypothetical protein [Sphingomonas sp. PAMC 26621]